MKLSHLFMPPCFSEISETTQTIRRDVKGSNSFKIAQTKQPLSININFCVATETAEP